MDCSSSVMLRVVHLRLPRYQLHSALSEIVSLVYCHIAGANRESQVSGRCSTVALQSCCQSTRSDPAYSDSELWS